MKPAYATKRIAEKMQGQDLPPLVIQSFLHYYHLLAEGHEGMISDVDIDPVGDVPRLEDLDDAESIGEKAMGKTVVIKLNGGLGTSMGLQRAKSLIAVKDGLSFLDIIVRQVFRLRDRYATSLPLTCMNSFSTEVDTQAALAASYPDLEAGQPGVPLSFLQNKVPKIRCDTLEPVDWPEDPSREWCPPGHGDLYTALLCSGVLERLLERGIRYAFVSNSDNLGAVLEPRILGWFADSGAPFLMEVTSRTLADRKGGHLARFKEGGLLLREAAQCPEVEREAFGDIERYRYFNTNNLWLNLPALKEWMEASGGFLKLPLIRNRKELGRTPVFQLETAMGSALSVFPDARALCVPRRRFIPVKYTNDLLSLRSDIFELTDRMEVQVNPARKGGTVVVDLDPAWFRDLPAFEERFPHGPPSLIDCESLKVIGDHRFGRDVSVEGAVVLENPSSEPVWLDDGSRLT